MLQRLGSGPMAVITQLCCCLAQLAIYMKGWDNPVEYVGRTLGTGATNASLEFLTVLPEELERTQPLLTVNNFTLSINIVFTYSNNFCCRKMNTPKSSLVCWKPMDPFCSPPSAYRSKILVCRSLHIFNCVIIADR